MTSTASLSLLVFCLLFHSASFTLVFLCEKSRTGYNLLNFLLPSLLLHRKLMIGYISGGFSGQAYPLRLFLLLFTFVGLLQPSSRNLARGERLLSSAPPVAWRWPAGPLKCRRHLSTPLGDGARCSSAGSSGRKHTVLQHIPRTQGKRAFSHTSSQASWRRGNGARSLVSLLSPLPTGFQPAISHRRYSSTMRITSRTSHLAFVLLYVRPRRMIR